MSRKTLFMVTIAAMLVILLFAGCTRRPLTEYGGSVPVPVKIDWNASGIAVDEADPTGSGLVHRVSFRFFPIDGSEPFEHYLEGNIFEGTIHVAPGRYRVVVMNESVHDVNYWGDEITFTDADDYDLFSASAVPMSTAGREARYPYYRPDPEENTVENPFALASWSLDELTVGNTRATTGALTEIVMRQLTFTVRVTARFQNLISAAAVQGSIHGLADKVYMASGRTAQQTGTQLFTLTGRVWEPDDTDDGTARATFLTFGRVPSEGAGSYGASLDALLSNGSLFPEEGSLSYDVTDQVIASQNPEISVVLPDGGDGNYIELPEVEGGIAVDPWEDEETTLH